MAGSATMLVIASALDITGPIGDLASTVLAATLIIDLFVTLIGEFSIPHASEVAARAAHDISHGRYRNHFWWGSVVLGHITPLALLLLTETVGLGVLPGVVAGVAAVAGLYAYEYAFVMAPQEIPNS
jgi:hypothetical protein